MSTQENAKIAQSIYEAFNSRDFDRAIAAAAEEVEIVNVPLGVTFRGHDGYRQFLQGWSTAFPDSRVEISQMTVGEESVATEFHGRGTHTGPLVTPAGSIPPTGRSIDISFCEVFQIKNGKLVGDHLYFDTATMMRQLGLA